MPQFNDSENQAYELQQPGDRILRVMDFEISIQSGGVTSGSEKYDVKIGIEDDNGNVVGMCHENLIDHEKTNWKIDTFLKSMGVKLAKGERFEFNEQKAKAKNVRWVDPLGLRGWGTIKVDTYDKPIGPPGPEQKKEKKYSNKVAIFITNKEKLPRAVVARKEEAATAPETQPGIEHSDDPDWG